MAQTKSRTRKKKVVTVVEPMGVGEVAELLDCPIQYIGRFRKQGRLKEPTITLKCGPIWEAADIREFKKEFDKTRRN